MAEAELLVCDIMKALQGVVIEHGRNSKLPVRITVNNRFTCNQVIHAGEKLEKCKVSSVHVRRKDGDEKRFLEIECDV